MCNDGRVVGTTLVGMLAEVGAGKAVPSWNTCNDDKVESVKLFGMLLEYMIVEAST
jgi:hypothetical protein